MTLSDQKRNKQRKKDKLLDVNKQSESWVRQKSTIWNENNGYPMIQTTTNGINILKTWAKGTFNPIIWDDISSVLVEETESWKKWKLSNGKKK